MGSWRRSCFRKLENNNFVLRNCDKTRETGSCNKPRKQETHLTQSCFGQRAFQAKYHQGMLVVTTAFDKVSQEKNELRKEWANLQQNREEMQGAQKSWHLQD